MTIEEVGKKVKNMGNGKGLWIIGGGFVILFLISLASQTSSEDADLEENVKLTGAYASYPDVATNADVVISTLQDSLDFQTEELSELMQGNFDATNDYIKEGIETNTAITQLTHADIMQGIEDLSSQSDRNTNTIIANSDKNTDTIIANSDKNTSTIMEHVSNESSSTRGTISSAKTSILGQMDSQYADMQTSLSLVSNSVDVARELIVETVRHVDQNNVNLKEDITDLKNSINNIGNTNEDFSVSTPINITNSSNSSGVDVFAPSVYYE